MALELADELLAAAEDAKDPAMLLSATLSAALFFSSSASWALRMTPGEGAGRFRSPATPSLDGVGGTEGSLLVLLYCCLCGLGYPDRAWAKSRETPRWLSGLPFLSFWLAPPARRPHIT